MSQIRLNLFFLKPSLLDLLTESVFLFEKKLHNSQGPLRSEKIVSDRKFWPNIESILKNVCFLLVGCTARLVGGVHITSFQAS